MKAMDDNDILRECGVDGLLATLDFGDEPQQLPEPAPNEADTQAVSLRPTPIREAAPAESESLAGLPEPKSSLFVGLANDVVNLYRGHSEAPPVAMVAQFLVTFGSAVGRAPYISIGAQQHHMNEYVLLIGSSGDGRKGDSFRNVEYLFQLADSNWSSSVHTGLSSSEGVVSLLSTASQAGMGQSIYEPEFTSVLQQFRRNGNTLSHIIRKAWDSPETVKTITKQLSAEAKLPHMSLIAHVTPEELQSALTGTDIANGLMNRFIILRAERHVKIPWPKAPDKQAAHKLADRIQTAVCWARNVGEISVSPEAEAYYSEIYMARNSSGDHRIDKLLARPSPHMIRLSALYALCAQQTEIAEEHMNAAQSLCDYAEACTRHLLGRLETVTQVPKMPKAPKLDRLCEYVREQGSLTRTELREKFGNHCSKEDLDQLIHDAEQKGLVLSRDEPTDGRPRQVIEITASASVEPHEACAESAISAKSAIDKEVSR